MLKWTGLAIIAVAGMIVLAWLVARSNGSDRAQREALAMMQAPWNPPGSNAFDALWLLLYPVAPDDMAGIVSRDAARMRQTPLSDGAGSDGPARFATEAAARHPRQSPDEHDRARLCAPHQSNCLDRVRADLPAYRALVQRNAALLERIAALERHGHVANRFPARVDMPFPPLDLPGAGTTHAAVLFAHGEVEAGLDAACRSLATWRRLGSNSDMLVAALAGFTYSSGSNGRLVADMLRALPAAQPIPETCRIAMRPPQPEELSLCQAMRGEFAFVTAAAGPAVAMAGQGQLPRMLLPVFYDEAKTRGMRARRMMHACTPQARDHIVSDLPFPVQPATAPTRLACIDNLAGCILESIAAPAYAQYANRALDHGARLRLLATLLWLRDGADDRRPLAARLADLPEGLRSPSRPVEISGDGRSLRIRQYEEAGWQGPYWEVSLPDDLSIASD
jgi:hypothetical protein